MNLKVYDIKTEYLENPIGLDLYKPRISFKIKSEAKETLLKYYQIIVAVDDMFSNVVWDTGKKESDDSILIEYDGQELKSYTRYFIKIKAWDNHSNESAFSSTEFFETAKLDKKWLAKFICDKNQNGKGEQHEVVRMFAKKFDASSFKSARIYATSLGVYEININGQRVGDARLTPGFTKYSEHLLYQTYDVTNLLKANNTLTAMVGKGWYLGEIGKLAHEGIKDLPVAFLMELHILKNDGTVEIIASDESFKVLPSGILYSDIYNGETFDRIKQNESYKSVNNNYNELQDASVYSDVDFSALSAQNTVVVKHNEVLLPKELITTKKGEKVIDFGQNMVGYVKIRTCASANSKITLEHAEVLDSEGNFYTENMRAAKNLITYICGGEKEEYHPYFTFQGFRYVKVNCDYDFDISDFSAIVIHSEMQLTNKFNSSNELLNQLHSNIIWGQKGNFVDVPTDCPQRDERLGWTGDAQMFASTACFNMNSASFYTKWLKDFYLDQTIEYGGPHFAPNINGPVSTGSAAWQDTATIVPFTMYINYNDVRILKNQYQSMKDLITFMYNHSKENGNPYLYNWGEHFGDWVALDAFEGSYNGSTYQHLISSAFYAYSTQIVYKTAKILNQEEDYKYYFDLYEKVKNEFNNEYVTKNGNIIQLTQTSHILPLIFDLVSEKNKVRIASKLAEIIKNNNGKMSTGFVGTPYLCKTLFDNGYKEEAFSLLFETEYPSWLYQVTKGATTIWEHLDGIKPDGSFWSSDMNSFNHYAYGAVGDFVYKTICGINPCEESPGYKHILLSPNVCSQLDFVSCEFESIYGTIKSSWKKENNGSVTYTFTIPANTTATILIGDKEYNVGSCNDFVLNY